jgi:predicted nucleic acid-binding protein
MKSDRLFLDTAFFQALLNPRDDFHDRAKNLFPQIRSANKVWITEAVVISHDDFSEQMNFAYVCPISNT